LVGTLISWIPVVGAIGYLLMLIGAILVILGRKAFGRTHARNVVASIVLFILGIVGLFAAAIPLGIAMVNVQLNGVQPDSAAQLESGYQTILVGGVVLSVLLGLASVLFTYALQNPMGRILLWSGYGANVALNIAIAWILSPLVPGAVQDALARGVLDPTPIANLESQQSALNLLAVLPALLFAGANYIAWSRIARREIPVLEPAPGAPPTAPPMTPR